MIDIAASASTTLAFAPSITTLVRLLFANEKNEAFFNQNELVARVPVDFTNSQNQQSNSLYHLLFDYCDLLTRLQNMYFSYVILLTFFAQLNQLA